jgi:G3E family GTPase
MSNSGPTFSPIPITIIGGFLGSGKTSLLNHILNNTRDMRIAVLVNDFGEINIDAKLIVSVEGESVVSLANGCVCCVIRDDLLTEVLRLFEKTPLPEHIVIETSGVSNPAAVADTFLVSSAQGLVEVQNLISVLDADLFLDEQDEQEEYRVLAIEQIKVADVVVINKIDLVEPQRLSEIKSKVVTIIPRARIWETAFGVVPLDLIFDDQMSPAMEGLKESHATLAGNNEHEQHDHNGENWLKKFASWTYRSEEVWSFSALQRAVEHLPRDIFRAKGMVRLDVETDDYGILQVTGRRGWLRLVEAESPEDYPLTTELLLIGKPGKTTNDSIREHFDQALEAANAPNEEGYLVTDLRAFNVIFV